ncbi:glycoside hydrolase family 53 protein [Saccharata proteae CBS 121410]|uniref:Arabinogalactan endo-beta-1,4-galactanase n=1 Tax=Saccharata proteae CBS 121410 TaxID=1314787 RepID=A0A9P4HNJ9_9PEZI|nr:glycoside hydrolase family 53 protein [Saccharata proteae CBS 121410]
MKYLLHALPWVAALLPSPGAAFLKGHDLSSVKAMEDEQGAHWYDTDGTDTAIEDILGNGGMDTVRLRIWTAEEYGLDYTLTLAKRFASAGYKIYLDMHFSDTWADAGTQSTPAAWDASSTTTLSTALRAYVSSTLQAFTAAGIDLAILSLGNEIRSGMLFPWGQIPASNDFSTFTALWAAARAGVADAVAAGVNQPQVMVHIDNGWDASLTAWFFGEFFGTGAVATGDVDVLGLSYYPFYGTEATLSHLADSMAGLASAYGKPIYVAETDWPYECSSVELSESFGVDAEGQDQWIANVVEVVRGVDGGLGAGVFYWEPGFINNTGLGSDCESVILFDVDWSDWPDTKATARSSVDMFA